MNDFKLFVQSEINKFSELYTGSPAADDMINLKILFDDWLVKKSKTVQNMYAIGFTEDKISYRIKSQLFSLRLTFYKSGKASFTIHHEKSTSIRMSKNDLSGTFNLDSGYVYFLKSQFGWKIGKTKNLYNRKKVFEVKLPFDFLFQYYIKTFEKSNLEKRLHNYFQDKLINGEWFNINNDEIENAARNLGYKLFNYGGES